MATEPSYTLTNESITVVLEGETYTTREGTLNFEAARQAILEKRWDDLPDLFSVGRGIQRWTDDNFVYENEVLTYQGDPLPQELMDRIIAMAEKGDDPTSLMKFWANLQENTSYRSVKQLYSFLQNMNIPIDEEGYVVAYKGIRRDYKDKWTGTIDNSPGSIIEMDRNKVSDDPNVACAEGLHLGSLDYAQGYASEGRVVVCRVNPRDVVSVPKDHQHKKMRTCRYEVLGNYGDKLDSVSFRKDDELEIEIEDDDEVTGDANAPWEDFGELGESELYNQHLDPLRKYARHVLQIIGASKIRGGKAALIKRILDVRSA